MNHWIVADLGYGDAGKGTVVDWLCASRPVHAVVRFNGGAQAAHTVVLRDGRRHTFAQFGSGALRPGVRTHLSRYVVVDPPALAVEADHLAGLGVADPYGRLTVDGAALLATPYHRAANRARERARGTGRHGSCGLGVGEAMAYALEHPGDAPRVADCLRPDVLAGKLSLLRSRLAASVAPRPLEAPPVSDCLPAYTGFASRVSIVDGGHLADLLRAGTVVFEGAQGVLLDEWHGFHPYTTWSTTTFTNAEKLLADAGHTAIRLGVLRVCTTRHGPGPLVTEDPALPYADPHNPTNPWQGAFRFGHFDAVAHRYALAVAGGADGLALTHLDLDTGPLRMCRSYDWTDTLEPGPAGDLDRQERLTRRLHSTRPVYGTPPTDWIDGVENALGVPVTLASYGPTDADKRPLGATVTG